MRGCTGRWIVLIAWIALGWYCSVPMGWGQTALKVTRIEFQGLQRVPETTARYYVRTRAGDLYDPEMLREDFRRLWGSGLFQNLRLETHRDANGVRVVFVVEEKPVIEEIVWPEKMKPLKQSDIESKMAETGRTVFAGDLYDPYRVFQVEDLIRQMLIQKGYQFPEVRAEIQPAGPGAVRLVWHIDPGENLRVGRIIFDGNHAFSDIKLRSLLPIKPSSLWWRIWGKDKYDPSKLEKGLEKLRDFYFNHGYIDFRVGEPRVEVYTDISWWDGDPVRRLKIIIPVEEGPRYRIADVQFEGNRVFSDDELRRMLFFRPGEWYVHKKVQRSVQAIQESYGNRGYIFVQVAPEFRKSVQGDTHTLTLVMNIREGKPQVVRRIEFQGNTYTYDLVVRRELEIYEGQLFTLEAFRRSLKKIFRLGYFDKVEPEIKPVEGKDDQIDVIIKVHENKRNQFQFGGGYSELEGFFAQLGFATQNLFGTGKNISFSVQYGKRIKTYQISYVDPFFMMTDWRVGIDIYNTWSDFFIYERRNRGGGILLGHPLTSFLDVRIGYSYTQVQLEDISPRLLERGVFGIPPEEFLASNRRDSRLTPSLVYNSLNDPIDPTQGTYATVSLGFSGSFLGGDVQLVRPTAKWTHYIQVNRHKHRFAWNLEAAWVIPYGGQRVPFYERFFLGGDFTIRGYDFRTVGPIDPEVSRRYTVGGTKYVLFNLEYIIPVSESPLRLVFFLDGGNAFAEDEPINFGQLRYSTGVEFRIIIPALMTPIRLIFARNWNRGPVLAPAWNFRFGIGKSF